MAFSRKGKAVLYAGIYFCSTIAPNYVAHVVRALGDSMEAHKYPIFTIDSNEVRLNDEYRLIMEHQRETLREAFKAWVLVPGSFLWRKVDKPDLERKIDKVNGSPQIRT